MFAFNLVGGANYKVTTYGSSDCTGVVTSSSTPALLTCAYQYTPVPYYPSTLSASAYVSNQCASGPTAEPTLAPSGPTPQPTSRPTTLRPTPSPSAAPTLPGTRYFVSQYAYDTSSCSGVPNTVTVYQLSLCFYTSSGNGYAYAKYTLGTSSARGYITFILSGYSNSACSGTPTYSTTYNLATSCSNGNNFTYTSIAPVVPQSISNRCLLYS